jgi:hypothetical protein
MPWQEFGLYFSKVSSLFYKGDAATAELNSVIQYCQAKNYPCFFYGIFLMFLRGQTPRFFTGSIPVFFTVFSCLKDGFFGLFSFAIPDSLPFTDKANS